MSSIGRQWTRERETRTWKKDRPQMFKLCYYVESTKYTSNGRLPYARLKKSVFILQLTVLTSMIFFHFKSDFPSSLTNQLPHLLLLSGLDWCDSSWCGLLLYAGRKTVLARASKKICSKCMLLGISGVIWFELRTFWSDFNDFRMQNRLNQKKFWGGFWPQSSANLHVRSFGQN